MHPTVAAVTARITERSLQSRRAYEELMAASRKDGPARGRLSCANLAHGFAAAEPKFDKPALRAARLPNIGIVTAYNDMLSAHRPFEHFPDEIREAARMAGATAQVAGGVPAMCDGVTQGRAGMELSLFSRDVIALASTIALSHDLFDAALHLGVCDKIVPGLFIAAARFGHLPSIFVPAGPMSSGIPNGEKAKVRQRFASGEATREELLEVEAKSYHSAGTCTFYGTANSNQLLMEAMGLHMPGAAFVHPDTPLRAALTRAATHRVAEITSLGEHYTPFAEVIDARSIVNAVVCLLATGGSTNHTLHLVAMAAAVGVQITWQDFADLSAVTPLLARIYPNGEADVNHFQSAGGVGFVIRELIGAGLLHEDVQTVAGPGLAHYTKEPFLDGDKLVWKPAPTVSLDTAILRPASDPFSPEGGLKLLSGNLGTAIIKTSAVKPEFWHIRAPAVTFASQQDLKTAFKGGLLDRDFVAVLRGQGPSANGMPELHELMPVLGALMDRGHRVAIITDGRMSGASGKVPAALHVTPEAKLGGAIGRIRDGDMIDLNAEAGILTVEVGEAELAERSSLPIETAGEMGLGRELFRLFRDAAQPASLGGGVFTFE